MVGNTNILHMHLYVLYLNLYLISIYFNICILYIWLVVSTPLKNISQIGSSSQLLGKIKNVPNHQPDKDITRLISTQEKFVSGNIFALRISWIQNKLIQQSELLKDDQNSTEKRWNKKENICISSIYRWYFPWNKPSSYWGTPIYGNRGAPSRCSIKPQTDREIFFVSSLRLHG